MFRIIFLTLFLNWFSGIIAQTSDNRYRVPLDEVLGIIQQRFEITINYPDELVDGKELDFAMWRLRPDLDESLKNVLTPFDLVFERQNDSVYRVTRFMYHRRSVEEGAHMLQHLNTLYLNQEEWEERKLLLQSCFKEALGLYKIPDWTDSPPVVSGKRDYEGYTVENVALETLPGVYLFGSIYKPDVITGKIPVIVSPNGHFQNGRYHKDVQARCAMLAMMGAVVMNYDLFAWGESSLQFASENHRKSLAMYMQALNGLRVLDHLLSLPEADPSRVGITGGSGGGSQTMLLSALDDRFTVSVPAVMLSSWFYGGCPCESGLPVHLCGNGTNNVEMAAMFAPKPMLIISDGGDWTRAVPEQEFPFLQRIYDFYNAKTMVENAHFLEEGHDYGFNKREAMYHFMCAHLGLKKIMTTDGTWDESGIVVENPEDMRVFGDSIEDLPAGAVRSFEELEAIWNLIKKL